MLMSYLRRYVVSERPHLNYTNAACPSYQLTVGNYQL